MLHRTGRWFAVLFALLLAACRSSSPPTLDPVIVTQGKALYVQHCAACHGANLEGQPNWKSPGPNGVYPAPPHNSDGHTWHHPDAVLLQIIAAGGVMPASAMPAFTGKLTDAEMQAILAYIKTFWGPKELAFQTEVTRNAQQ